MKSNLINRHAAHSGSIAILALKSFAYGGQSGGVPRKETTRDVKTEISTDRGGYMNLIVGWMNATVKGACMFVGLVACASLGFAPSAFAEGTVYAMTNQLSSSGGNNILVYHRASDGTLSLIQTIATTGGGSGTQLAGFDSLGSQGSVMLDEDHERLFVVNTESAAADTGSDSDFPGTEMGDCNEGSISSFKVAADGTLTFVQKISSGGLYPDSLTIKGRLLYVLNAGGGPNTNPVCTNFTTPNITGFTLKGARMTALSGSTQPIDSGGPSSTFGFLNCDNTVFPFSTAEFQCGINPPPFPRSPGELKFTANGKQLVVTDKGPNKIYVFPILKNGTPGDPTVHKATGPSQPTYFGFNFDAQGHLIVSEPFSKVTIPSLGSALSSFSIAKDGSLTAISSSVTNTQGTSCWVVLDPATKKYVYVSNNASPTLSSYTVGSDGSLTVLADPAATVALPNDLAVALDTGGSFLYVVQSGPSDATAGTVGGTVGVFQINADGSLTRLQQAAGLPVNMGAQGLAAY